MPAAGDGRLHEQGQGIPAFAPLPPGLDSTARPSRIDAAGSPPRLRGRIESLRLIETACWHEMAAAARERGHRWRVMTLATIDGDRADARSVVLREVDAAQRKVMFYTDERSPKVAQIQARPLGTAVAWCPSLSWQVRLRLHLSVQAQNDAARQRWSLLQMTPSAHDYMSPLAPGETLSDPGQDSGAREHFAIVVAQVEALDWLELHADGHRRAVFDGNGPRWVQP
jgi:pyridoxamine 5'-phosphate oxidase